MGIRAYLGERIVSIACWLVAAAIVCIMLLALQVGTSVVLLIAITLGFALVVDLAVGYATHHRFWDAVASLAERKEGNNVDPLATAQDLPYPSSACERAVDGALRACSQAAYEDIARARADACDYRTFVEAWSHEIKTPLHTATLKAAADPSLEGQAIARDLERVDGYVDQALYYARSSSVDRDFSVRETSLAQVVTDALHTRTQQLVSQGVAVRLENLDYTVICDAKWVRFMLGQLIDNACKYADATRPQTLSFTARLEDEGMANERVVLSVADSGLGIPASDIGRIFDKGFVGTNGRREGQAASTGLGLWLVKVLAEKTGLAVDVESVEGEGATFFLSFAMNRLHYLER